MLTNDYYLIGMVALNRITVYKLFGLDRNTWYLITVQTMDYYYSQIKKYKKITWMVC